MNRRQFIATGIGGILLAATAPAIVRASSLMPLVIRRPYMDGWYFSHDGEIYLPREPEYDKGTIILCAGHWKRTQQLWCFGNGPRGVTARLSADKDMRWLGFVPRSA